MSETPISYTIDAAVMASGIGSTTMYGLAAEGKIRFVKVGKRTLVDAQSLRDYIASLPAADIRVPSLLKRRALRDAPADVE